MGSVSESSVINNFSVTKKLHNLIFSDNFCGLCFENGAENIIEQEIEVINDDCRTCISLGEIYLKVFHEKPADLASNTICNSCMEQLKQSYTFIQNTKSVTKLLYRYVDKLKSKIIRLIVQLKQTDLDTKECIALFIGKQTDTINITSNKCLEIQRKTFSTELLEEESCFFDNNLQNPMQRRKGTNTNKICLQKYIKRQAGNHNKVVLKYVKDTVFEHIEDSKDQILLNPKPKYQDCDFTHKRKETLKPINKYNVEEKSYICGYCNKKFRSKKSLKSHVASHKVFKCQYCGLNLNYKSTLEIHTSFCKEKNKQVEKEVKGTNEKEGKETNEKEVKETNEKEVTETNEKQKNDHVDTQGTVFCSCCKKSFDSATQLKNHHKTQDAQCLKSSLTNPEKSKQLKTPKNELKEAKKQKPHLLCELCDYKAWNSILLECHMNRYHLKIKPYICHICSKDFIGKHLLKKHLKLHTVDRSVVCTECGKKLANSNCLRSHLKLHTGERNYPCDVCGEKFRSSSIMNVHKIKRHSDKEAACPLCPSKFFTLVELRRHVVKIHWKKETKFDPRQLEGLEDYYHLFHDGRRIMMDDREVDFYLPC